MRYHRYLIIALALLLVFAPATVARAQSPASWTVLIYLDGDNNLEREAIDDFIEMSAIASNADLNIVVQFDRISGYDSRSSRSRPSQQVAKTTELAAHRMLALPERGPFQTRARGTQSEWLSGVTTASRTGQPVKLCE